MLRTTQSLNGIWEFRTDPQGEGERAGWADSLPGGRPVAVPGYWQLYSPELQHYSGTAWYQRTVDLPAAWSDKAIFLRFEAVDYHAALYVNGEKIGEHEGGYLPFEFDITRAVRLGSTNLITLTVTDPADLSEVPHGKQGGSWYTPVSGIWQDVVLEVRPRRHITEVKVSAATGSVEVQWTGAEARIEVEWSRPYRYKPVWQPTSVALEEGDGEPVRAEAAGAGKALLHPALPNPHLWSPEEPWLYTATVKLLEGTTPVDQVQVEFGIRTFTHREGQFYLNDRLIHLRGALDQAYWPLTLYTPPSEEAIRNEILLAQGMGLNLLRKHIKPEVPLYLRWANRLGMLIWAEVANPITYSDLSKRRLAAELEALIDRDWNHPSVIIYSIYNEEWGVDFRLEQDREKQEWLAAVYDRVKAKDPSRLYCDNSGWTHVKTDINDYHKYYASPERGRGWEEELDQMLSHPAENWVTACRHDVRGQPVVISEWGIWGLPDLRSLEADYGGRVYWHDRDWSRFRDFKRQPEALVQFERLGLGAFFADFGELAAASQQRQWRGIKHQAEEMRRRPGIAGYVVTELQDIEWEGNGWLDYFRRHKTFTHLLPDVNGPLVILPLVTAHNLWSGETLACDLAVINDSPQDAAGTIHYRLILQGVPVAVGELAVSVPACGRLDLNGAIELAVPSVDGSCAAVLEFTWGAVRNQVELTVTGSLPSPCVRIEPYQVDPELVDRLIASGYQLGQGAGTVLVTQTFDRYTTLEAKGARSVLYLAEDGIATGEGQPQFTFRRLSPGESWDMSAAMFFIATARFPGLPLRKEMGWETAPLAPEYVIADLDTPDYRNVISGYFQGWLGRYGATALEREVGSGVGKVLTTTLRFRQTYGKDPIATALLHHLINQLR